MKHGLLKKNSEHLVTLLILPGFLACLALPFICWLGNALGFSMAKGHWVTGQMFACVCIAYIAAWVQALSTRASCELEMADRERIRERLESARDREPRPEEFDTTEEFANTMADWILGQTARDELIARRSKHVDAPS